MKYIVFLFGIIFLFSCKTETKQASQTEILFPSEVNSSINIEFSQFSCQYPGCYEFNVRVKEGVLTYVKGDSITSKSLLPEQLKQLKLLLSQIDFEKTIVSFKPGGLGCSQYKTDQVSYKIQNFIATKSKPIEVYAGCESIPLNINNLVQWFLSLDIPPQTSLES